MNSIPNSADKLSQQLSFAHKLCKLLLSESDFESLIREVLISFYSLEEFSFVWILLFDKNLNFESFQSEGLNPDSLSFESSMIENKFPAPIQTVIDTGEMKVFTENQENCLLPVDFKTHSHVITPLQSKGNKYGLMGASILSKSVWSENEFEFFRELVDDISATVLRIKQAQDLRQMIEDSKDGIVSLDAKLKILDVNPAFCQLIELNREEVVGLNGVILAEKLFKGSNLKSILNAAKQVLAGKSSKPFEVVFKGKILSVITNFEKLAQTRIAIVKDITEIRKGELISRQNEEKLNNLVNALQDSVFIAQDGIIKLVNKSICQLSEYREHELLGTDFFRFIASEEIEKVRNIHELRLSGGVTPEKYESTVCTRSGKRIPVEISVISVDYESKPAWQVVLHDISEQKRIQERIERAHNDLKKAQQIGNMGSWMFDMSTHKVSASEQSYKIYGYDINVQKLDLSIIQKAPLPEYREILDKALKNLIEGKAKYDVEFKIRNQITGQILDIHSIAEYDPESNTVSGIIQDVTSQKKAEAKLIEIATNFSNIFNVNHDTISILDTEGRIVEVNQTFVDRMEYSKEELLGKSISLIDLDVSDETVKKVVDKIRSNQKILKMEATHTTKSGHSFPVEIHSKLIVYNGQESILSIARDITERVSNFQALEEKEELFRSIFENKGTATAILDKDGYILLANQQCSNLSGYTREELEGGMSWMAMVHPDDYGLLAEQQKLRNANPDTAQRAYEARLFNSRKEVRNVLINIEATKNLQRVASLVDITERIKAENRLREQKNFVWLLIDNMPVQIFWKNTDMVYRGGNAAFAKVVGFDSPKKVKGKTEADFLRPSDYNQKYLKWDKKVMESGKPMNNHEEPFFRADGSRGIALTSRIPLFDENGKVDGLLGFSVDITEIKKAETELKESEARFKNYIESSPYGVFVVDETGKYIDVNTAGTELTGYTREEFENLSIHDFILPEEEEYALNAFRQMIQENKPMNIDTQYKRKDGELRHWDVNAIRIGSNRFLGFSHDITERKKNEQELLLAKTRAEESDRLKSAFLATVSHELRTPLNHILGFSDLIPELTKESEVIEFSNYINKSGMYLMEIIEDIFNLAMIEQKQIKIRKNEVFIRDIFLDLKKQLQEALADSNKTDVIDLEFSIDKELVTQKVITDKPKIIQAVSNILKNAVKYTHQGTISLKIELQNENLLRISVTDTGIGIPADKLDIIFDFFRQGDDSHTREYGGVGIGLALARKIADALEGRIEVSTQVGKGSVFVFNVPVSNIAKQKESALFIESKTKLPNLASKYILVAEDDGTSMELIGLLLKPLNCVVLKAWNGAEALQMVRENQHIDLVFMDLKMPVMDGFISTQEIRKINQDVPVIALTAHALSSEKKRAMEAGCNDLITKPINRNLLYKLLENILG